MAGFEGIKWAKYQRRLLLKSGQADLLEGEAKVYAISRSIHYALFLAFEGIRFYVRQDSSGLSVVFVNWERNLQRFIRSMKFNLNRQQHEFVPSAEALRDFFLGYFQAPEMQDFLREMAENNYQGYLRPFTCDEEQSIGVTFPNNPGLRVCMCYYRQYMGEPFSGVVIPHLVRAVGINGTGCLKLGVNYLMSVKAVEEAKTIWPTAASALFLDDNPTADLYSRKITEWDSSCCLIGLRDGTTIKIPESSLILPSVTIQGMVAILKHLNQPVVERDITYGEFVEKSRKNEIIAVCSIGTAGILNRCERIALIDEHKHIIGEQVADPTHPLYQKYGEAKKILWDIYKGEFPAITGMQRDVYPIR